MKFDGLVKMGIQLGEVLLTLPLGAFSPGVAREMFRRDNGTCQSCGRTFNDGYMMHASHFSHEHDQYYNDIGNGQLECIRCHLFIVHVPLFQSDATPENRRPVELLVTQVVKEGYHTWKHYEFYPQQKDVDIEDMKTQLERRGLDYLDFLLE